MNALSLPNILPAPGGIHAFSGNEFPADERRDPSTVPSKLVGFPDVQYRVKWLHVPCPAFAIFASAIAWQLVHESLGAMVPDWIAARSEGVGGNA